MYIRTKDKIIAFGEKYAYPTRLSNGKTYFSFQELTEDRFEVMKKYNHWEILKQSENLEELCDMFVCGGTGFEMPSEMPLSHTTQYQKMKILIKFGMIGGLDVWLKLGIWTSKGLIYVAKMNDKGELELI